MRGAVTNFVLLGVNIGHLGEVNGLLIMQESTDLLKKKIKVGFRGRFRARKILATSILKIVTLISGYS